MKVKPTTAYVGDSTDGKLTLYVPYYGATGIGQISLSASASGNVQIKNMQIINKSSTDTQVEVNFTLDEGDAEDLDGSLPMVIDGAFDMTKVTVNDNNEIVAGNGFSESTGSATWLRPSGDYTRNGNTFTQTISLDINKSKQSSRTGAVVVYSPSGREVTRFVVNQSAAEGQDANNEIFNATVLGDKESANCYTISSPGRYELKPYKGAYRGTDYVSAQKCSGKPVLIACDNSDISIVFCEPDGVSQRILFDVNPTISNGKVTGHRMFNAGGNAVIGLQNDKGEIQWSWHLWFNTEVLGIGGALDQVYTTNQTLMDRNIGASLPSSSGVYYSWGKKEPFLKNTESEATKAVGAEEYHGGGASSQSWSGTSKAVSDPCPPGYMAPSSNAYVSEKNANMSYLSSYFTYEQMRLLGDVQQLPVVYPYSGFVAEDGKKSLGKSGSNIPKTKNLDIPVEYTRTITLGRASNPAKFIGISYSEETIVKGGYLWDGSKNLIKVGYNNIFKKLQWLYLL